MKQNCHLLLLPITWSNLRSSRLCLHKHSTSPSTRIPLLFGWQFHKILLYAFTRPFSYNHAIGKRGSCSSNGVFLEFAREMPLLLISSSRLPSFRHRYREAFRINVGDILGDGHSEFEGLVPANRSWDGGTFGELWGETWILFLDSISWYFVSVGSHSSPTSSSQ